MNANYGKEGKLLNPLFFSPAWLLGLKLLKNCTLKKYAM